MSAKDFKFVSPGVQVEEIDNSQLPAIPDAIGPLVIGRSRRGPAMQPVKVDSFSEFVTIFGDPVAGGEASDLWRSGIPTAPTFAAYAAQAWLKNSTPLTFIRLLGDQSPDAASTSDAKAGYKPASPSGQTGGGAYGLFLFNSGSDLTMTGSGTESVEGTLAAVFYTTAGAVTLSGTIRGGATQTDDGTLHITTTSSNTLVIGTGKQFTAQVFDGTGGAAGAAATKTTLFNFDKSSQNYIRKVFNTNATFTNTNLVDSTAATATTYWLGQTFDREVQDKITSTDCYGMISFLGESTTSIDDGGDFEFATRPPRSGWFISQDLRNTAASTTITENVLTPVYNPQDLSVVTRLFKVHGLSSGEEIQRKYKVSIEDIQYSKTDSTPYGSFTLSIRHAEDSDNARVYVERFTNLSLDPNSPQYIAKQIGDRYYEWSNDQRRLVEYGTYPNRSKIIRMEMANAVDTAQINAELLPFGVEGPQVYTDFTLAELVTPTGGGSTLLNPCGTGSIASNDGTSIVPVTAGSGTLAGQFQSNAKLGVNSTPYHASAFDKKFGVIVSTPQNVQKTAIAAANNNKLPVFSGSVKFPRIPLRNSASDGGLSDPTEAYFGVQYSRQSGSTLYEESMTDLTYPLPAGGTFDPVANTTQTSFYFSLDDIMLKENTKNLAYYDSGSRARGDSITARTGSYKAVLDKGYDRFTSPLFGGFNGFDITEEEPFNDERALVAGGSPEAYSGIYTVRKAIDMFADPEFIEANILTLPGIVNEGLTTHALRLCEERGDALMLMDPRGGYAPASENNKSEQARIDPGVGKGGISQHVVNVGEGIELRNLNSSYGAVYYPWVRITDTITGRGVWAPPSVAALGAMSFSEKEAALWFAPAGFNRGGLTDGAAGIPVTNVRSRLTSKERDFLYDRNVNPIASFPSEGIVIFGQKTLQATPSALDRINVRRLMIFVKKEISRIAANLLFEPNVPATWARFTGQVNPFLDNIKNNFGLDAFRVVLDDTTTTAEMIDRNTIYAKIFLKPTKAVEFFAIDFVITNSGAGFED